MVRLILNVEVGNLTEVKISKLTEILHSHFPNGVSSNNQLIASNGHSQMIITPGTIQYLINGEYDDKLSEQICKVYELLLLDFNCSNCSVIETDIIKQEKNYMDLTCEKFPKLIDDAIGVGIRSFFSYDGGISEIRIEPFLSDSNSIYIEAIYNMNNVDIKTINEVIKTINRDYNIKKESLLKDI